MKPDTNNPLPFSSPGLPHTASEEDKIGSRLENQEQTTEIDELRFDSVPPKKSVTVSVRYRIRGRGQPLPYPLDEEDGQ